MQSALALRHARRAAGLTQRELARRAGVPQSTVAGVSGYDELAANAVEEDLGGVPVKVSTLNDLITMKLAAGRPKDRIEVEVLAAVRDEIEHRR